MSLLDISPDSDNLVSTSGVTYHPQNETGKGNVNFYEINTTSDEIVIDVTDNIGALDNPVLIWNSVWGPTDFDLVDERAGDTVVSENSGYHSDVWIIDISGTSGVFKLTNFDDTQAGWYSYVEIAELEGA